MSGPMSPDVVLGSVALIPHEEVLELTKAEGEDSDSEHEAYEEDENDSDENSQNEETAGDDSSDDMNSNQGVQKKNVYEV